MRIRIKALPRPGELDEFDLRRFRVGEAYEVLPQLASLLILAGYADPIGGRPALATAAAADNSRKRPVRKGGRK